MEQLDRKANKEEYEKPYKQKNSISNDEKEKERSNNNINNDSTKKYNKTWQDEDSINNDEKLKTSHSLINNDRNKSELEITPVREKRGNIILRQELNSCTPDCNAKNALICNFLMFVLFAGVGMIIINY